MRNVWKGLIIGGLTGVAAGILLDAGDRASRIANEDVRRAGRAARLAMQRSKLPGRMRSVTLRAGRAPTTDQARDLASRATGSAVGTMNGLRPRSAELAQRIRAAAAP
jgi:hypothetical protein